MIIAFLVALFAVAVTRCAFVCEASWTLSYHPILGKWALSMNILVPLAVHVGPIVLYSFLARSVSIGFIDIFKGGDGYIACELLKFHIHPRAELESSWCLYNIRVCPRLALLQDCSKAVSLSHGRYGKIHGEWAEALDVDVTCSSEACQRRQQNGSW